MQFDHTWTPHNLPNTTTRNRYGSLVTRAELGTAADCPHCEKWFHCVEYTGTWNQWKPVRWYHFGLIRRIREYEGHND